MDTGICFSNISTQASTPRSSSVILVLSRAPLLHRVSATGLGCYTSVIVLSSVAILSEPNEEVSSLLSLKAYDPFLQQNRGHRDSDRTSHIGIRQPNSSFRSGRTLVESLLRFSRRILSVSHLALSPLRDLFVTHLLARTLTGLAGS